ncbi:hypothetical protein TNCV_4440381 [Trichonephila clavipes]|nr:hypothetical protein TNCV_4440381 [Trichonephila clavipes]
MDTTSKYIAEFFVLSTTESPIRVALINHLLKKRWNGKPFKHSSSDFFPSFNQNRFRFSSGQHIQIPSSHNQLPKPNPRYGAFFADSLNDDIHAEQLSGC